jgi:hypothetical protein
MCSAPSPLRTDADIVSHADMFADWTTPLMLLLVCLLLRQGHQKKMGVACCSATTGERKWSGEDGTRARDRAPPHVMRNTRRRTSHHRSSATDIASTNGNSGVSMLQPAPIELPARTTTAARQQHQKWSRRSTATTEQRTSAPHRGQPRRPSLLPSPRVFESCPISSSTDAKRDPSPSTEVGAKRDDIVEQNPLPLRSSHRSCRPPLDDSAVAVPIGVGDYSGSAEVHSHPLWHDDAFGD